MQHITVCLTAIASRASTLHLTLESLARQDHPDFSVRVYVSREPYLLDEGDFRISAECRDVLRSSSRTSFHYVPNVGPYRKILPFLGEYQGQNRLVATADDDTAYPTDWLSSLAHHYAQRRCIIAFRGHQMLPADDRWQDYRRWMTSGVKDKVSMLSLPTGKDGVLYNTVFFHRNVLDITSAMKFAPTADDLWLKWHTAFAAIPVCIVNFDYTTQSFPDVAGGHSLYRSYNAKGGNDEAIRRLENYAQATFGESLLRRIVK